MDHRVMMKLMASGECVSLRTVSRGFRSHQRFIVLEDEFQELEEKRKIIVSDIHSFAKLRLCRTMEGMDTLVIVFTWLSDDGMGKVAGMEETLEFPYRQFREAVEKSRSLDGACQKMLSIYGRAVPEIEFRSRNNLKAVAGTHILRKKLGKFFSTHFAWKGSRKIVVYDDCFEPYSFSFCEETPYGSGMCGGIILHGRENLKKAYYGMHT